MSPELVTPLPHPPGKRTDELEAIRLLWHILHLSNTLLSQLGAFLSLEALHRDSISTGLVVPAPHLPLMHAQATMMVDGCRNLDVAVNVLTSMPEHLEMVKSGGYQYVLEGARKLSATVAVVGRGIHCKDDVEMLRSAHDEMVVLCYGDASKNIRGWKEAWNEVFGYGKQ